MISQKQPDFDALFDSAKVLQKSLSSPSGKLLEKYQALGAEPGQLGDLLKDNRLTPAQKAQLAHSLEGYRQPEVSTAQKVPMKVAGRTRGPRRMI